MNTFRKSIVAVVTAALVSTSMVTTFNSANAREMRGGHWGGGHGGHRHHGGGMRGFGTGMAVGAGLALVGAVIAANNHREMVARIRYDRAVRKAPTKPPVVIAKKTRECDLVEAWKTLLKSAEERLAKDTSMNKEYGEDVRDAKGNVVRTNHSSDHMRFQQEEVDRIKEELRKAEEACKKANG